jgi:hypothetical protein
MRWREIVEAATNDAFKQTQKAAEALRKLRAKQAAATADRAAARAMPTGQGRSDRLRAADAREADARRVYGDALKKANDTTPDA